MHCFFCYILYYGKQLIEYESIKDGTLSELNQLGKGQIIDKSYTFKSGAKVTLDGVMLDDNKMIAFYSTNDPDVNIDSIGDRVAGAFGRVYYGGGHGMVDKKIELKLMSFGGDHDTKELVELTKGESKDIQVLEQDIRIDNVYEEKGKTYITITTEESLILSRVHLNINGESKELIQTTHGNLDKIVEGNIVRIYNTRTLEFEGTGEELVLDIQRIRYNKEYNQIIYTYKID